LPRPATTSAEAILDAVTRLAGENGPAAASIQAISAATGASVGSLYHRFASREALLAQAWLRAAEVFLSTFVLTLNGCGTVEDGVQAALVTPRWARENRYAAALILSQNRNDFLSAGVPAGTLQEAGALAHGLNTALQGFVGRVGITDLSGLARCRYALIGIADGAVRLYLPGRAPPIDLDSWVEAAYRGVMTPR